ncbi:MAG TPA: 50S ribosomal protein L25 [Planctomycetota bacterium]|nr:50S ribosomal protein L25 [Planctomycetota bacterium]
MQILDLPVEKRESSGTANARRARRQGRVPCILYGGKQQNVPLFTSATAFGNVLKQHSALVRLRLGDQEQTALLREVKWDVMGEYVQHIDFVRVEMTDEVKIKVPVHTFGVPVGIGEGGELQVVKAEIEVFSRVDSIPNEIRIDVSALKLFDGVHVREVTFPAHVRPAGHETDLIVHVVPPRKVEEAAPAEAAAAAEGAAPSAEPVVEPKGKAAKEGKEEGAAETKGKAPEAKGKAPEGAKGKAEAKSKGK